jgi:hypothetical protein
VIVDALTTDTSQTIANPNGTFTWTSNMEPVRVRRGKSWVATDATLTKNADGSFSPGAATSALRISGGGTGPLATLSSDGTELALTFPMPLPVPVVTGDTATYTHVLPGVDLQVTATIRGGLSEVLVVHSAEAAANPALKVLHIATTTKGLNLATDAGGNVHAKDADGDTVFTAPTPTMWDSSRAAGVPAGEKSTADRGGPAYGGQRATVRVTRVPAGLDLTPDPGLVSAAATKFPVFIDPAWTATKGNDTGGTTNYLNAWDGVEQCAPNTSNYDSHANGDPGVGYQGFASACGTGKERAYYNVQMPPELRNSSVYILPGTGRLHAEVSYAAQPGHTDTVYAAATAAFGAGTTWNNQPCRWSIGNGACSANQSDIAGSAQFTPGSSAPYLTVSFDITAALQDAGRANYPNLAVGLFNSTETDDSAFVRFATTVHTYFTAEYDYPPNTPTANEMTSSPVVQNGDGSRCGNGGYLGRSAGNSINLNDTPSTPTPYTPLGAYFSVADMTKGTQPVHNVLGNGGSYVGAGGTETLTVNGLIDADRYQWQTMATDGTLNSPPGPVCSFVVDQTSPTVATASSPQFPSGGTSMKVHSPGTFTVTANDPAPAGNPAGTPSGLWCVQYVFDGTLSVPSAYATCSPGADTVMSPSIGATTATVTLPAWSPPIWGTHDLKVVAVDRAGNTSTPFDYSFYVPDDPNARPAPGDLTGDGQPDYLSTDAAGNLVLYQANLSPSAGAMIASPAAEAPGGSNSWTGWQITHRGSMHGLFVDDLLVHRQGHTDSSILYIYKNDGAGHFTRANSVTSVTIATGSNTYNQCGCDFAQASQIIALGHADAGTVGAAYPTAFSNPISSNVTYFIAVAPDSAGINQMWLFKYHAVAGGTAFYSALTPISAFTSNAALSNTLLYSPGDATGDGLPDLWGTNTSTGAVIQFASALNADGSVNWAGVGGGNGSTTIATVGSGYQRATVSSPGNRDANGDINLWGVDTSGDVVLWRDPVKRGTATPSVQSTATAGVPTVNGPVLTWMLGNGSRPGQTGPASVTDVVTNSSGQITTEYDAAGNDYNGAATGNVVESNAHDGGAAVFDAATGEQIATSSPVVDTSKSFTVSAWVNLNDTTTTYPVAAQNGHAAYGFWFGYDHTLNSWALTTTNGDAGQTAWYSAAGPAGSVLTKTWTHLVGTYSASTQKLRLYVNAAAQGRQDTWATPFTAPGTFSVGRALVTSNAFNGAIDDVQVWQRALDQSEIDSLYDASRPRPLAPSGLSTANGTTATVCSTTAAGAGKVASLTPTLRATASDSDTTVPVHADFEMWDVTDATQPQPIALDAAGSTTPKNSGPAVSTVTPTLINAHTYSWTARTAMDDGTLQSEFSPPCYFTATTDGTQSPSSGAVTIVGDNALYPASRNTTWTGPVDRLVFQSDGNLVARRNSDNAALWASNTAGNPAACLVMQKDGNLVIYNGTPTITKDSVQATAGVLWKTRTDGQTNARVVIKTDGSIGVYAPGNAAAPVLQLLS